MSASGYGVLFHCCKARHSGKATQKRTAYPLMKMYHVMYIYIYIKLASIHIITYIWYTYPELTFPYTPGKHEKTISKKYKWDTRLARETKPLQSFCLKCPNVSPTPSAIIFDGDALESAYGKAVRDESGCLSLWKKMPGKRLSTVAARNMIRISRHVISRNSYQIG